MRCRRRSSGSGRARRTVRRLSNAWSLRPARRHAGIARPESEHAKQRHLEAGARIRCEREVASSDDRRLVVELHVFGGECFRQLRQQLRGVNVVALVIVHGLLHGDAHEQR